jgi:hypothetical protein
MESTGIPVGSMGIPTDSMGIPMDSMGVPMDSMGIPLDSEDSRGVPMDSIGQTNGQTGRCMLDQYYINTSKTDEGGDARKWTSQHAHNV